MNGLLKKHLIVLIKIFIFLLFIMEVVFNLKSLYLWNDESFTFHIINHNFSQIIELTSKDVHPFLYYFIAKLSIYYVNNIYNKIFILRLINFIPYLLLLLITNVYIKKLFSNITSIYFMFFIITMPILVNDLYQIRMYSWVLLFVTITFLLLIYSYKYKNNLFIFILVSLFSLLSSYTHYYGLLSVIILYTLFLFLFVLYKRKIIFMLISIFIDIFAYLPWFIILMKQINNVSKKFWTYQITIKYEFKIFLGIALPINNIFFYFISTLFMLILFYLIIKERFKNKIIIIIGLISPLMLTILGFFISIVVQHNVLQLRYITPSLGMFWLSISILLSQINFKFINKLFLILILFIGIISYSYNLLNVNNYSNEFNKTLFVYSKINNKSNIIYDNSDIMYSASSYLKNNYVLPDRNNDALYTTYKKVFNNINETNGLNLPNNKQTYFISNNKVNHDENKNSEYRSKLSNDFFKKYKLKKLYNIYLPLDEGKSIVYKVIQK